MSCRGASLVACLLACGAPAAGPRAPRVDAPAQPAVARPASSWDRVAAGAPRAADERPAGGADPVAALAPSADESVAFLGPAPVRLALDLPATGASTAPEPLAVRLLERAGGHVRLGVRLPHARFAAWAPRDALVPAIAEDVALRAAPGAPSTGARALLRAGARVTRLAVGDGWILVRYAGRVEVEGWVPAAALTLEVPAEVRRRPVLMRGRRLVHRGSAIRDAARPGGRVVAIATGTPAFEVRRELPEGWAEVAYVDPDVDVTGFFSVRGPAAAPRSRPPEREEPAPPVVATARVPSGTCLHDRAGGEPIGYVVGELGVDLAPAGPGWWTVTLDSPWGGLAFAARGATPDALAACAPPSGP